MADRLRPQDVELVERIRKFEKELFKEHNFKLYKNYYVPEQLVKNSKKVLSFGVGGDANFEKLICLDNRELDVRMFDPTPYTVKNIGAIINKGGWKVLQNLQDGKQINKEIIQKCLTFQPIAYAPNIGLMKFYYKSELGASEPQEINGSFSLATSFDNDKNFVEVKCQNIKFTLEQLGWDHVDILKTDVEGLWYEVGKEIKDIDVKYWVTEIELGLGKTINESFDQVRELYQLHKDKYNIYVNRKRLKGMLELIFYRKDIDES